jgi:ABC transporter, permease protein
MNIKLSRKLKENITGFLLLLPSLIFMMSFTVLPVFKSFYLSFTKYNLGMKSPRWIGFENYMSLFKSELFWKVMFNTIFFSVITVVPSMILGLTLAFLVNRKSRAVGILRTIYFYPVVMPMIAVASIWMFIYMGKNGLLDQWLSHFGIKPLNVLSNKNTVLPFMAIMYVWKESGYLMIFFLAGLQGISEDLLESARIDGAGFWVMLKNIILPLLKPTMIFVSTVALTNCFKLVDHIVIMTEGAPNNASTLLLYYIYQQGFTNFNYGKSSALTVIMLFLLLFVSLPRFFKQDREAYYN